MHYAFIFLPLIFVIMHCLFFLTYVYIYLVYNIALNMSYMNHSRFPSTPPPVLYNTKIHIMPARIILDVCKPGCFVSELLTEIKNNGGGH